MTDQAALKVLLDQVRAVEAGLVSLIGSGPNWSGGLRGVQAQFDEGWDPVVLDWAKAAGINPSFVRFNFIRPADGSLDFSSVGHPAALTKMKSLGIGHTLTLFYGTRAWDGDFAGFGKWAAAAMAWEEKNFPGTLRCVEIWNEPDGSWPVSASDYVQMARAVHDAVRANPALGRIPLAGAVTWGSTDSSYWQAVISAGLLNYVDMLSFHDYGPTEGLLTSFDVFKGIVGPDKPFYVSEWDDVAENVGKRLTIYKALGMRASAFFVLRDYEAFPTGGLLTETGAVKPETVKWNEWFKRVGSTVTYVGRDVLNSACYSFIFKRTDGSTVRHMWATADTPITIDGVKTLLTSAAIYVEGAVTVRLDATPGVDVLLADLSADFKLVQNQPFRYLSRTNDDSAESNLVVQTDHWNHPSDEWCGCFSGGRQHPGANNKSVVRWVSLFALRVKIDGSVARGDGGDGTNVRILHNKEVIFSKLPLVHSDGRVAFSILRDLAPGDYLDFEAHMNASTDFDAINWGATKIYQTS